MDGAITDSNFEEQKTSSVVPKSSNSKKNMQISSFKSGSPSNPIEKIKTLKRFEFLGNENEFLTRKSEIVSDLERLEVEFEVCLKEFEFGRVPRRIHALSILGEVRNLKCLTKLSICHLSIRYLPPEIGCLKKLVELDLSFNKLKNLPYDISELDDLKSLRVANNKLVDLPPVISCLRRLKNLDLSSNRLTSLSQLKLTSMKSLQYLNLQYNDKLPYSCQIPPWIICKLGGYEEAISVDDMDKSLVEVKVSYVTVSRVHGNRPCNGCPISSPCFHPEYLPTCRCSSNQRMKKGWKRRDSMQQRARQERLNYSRQWRSDDCCDDMVFKMSDEQDSLKSILLEMVQSDIQFDDSEDKQNDYYEVDEVLDSRDCDDNRSSELSNITRDDGSCITESSSLINEPNSENESASSMPEVNSSFTVLNLKRHCDEDPDNPKPTKLRKPEDSLFLSCKYNTESFCSIDDHLPDGFYDAGRDRPFMSLEEYEQSLSLDSREVILLDRGRDEELDAIASSAQSLLSRFRGSWSEENKDYEVDDLKRVSILALFVSDCFGGSDRSASVIKLLKNIVGSKKQQPFICTCLPINEPDKGERTKEPFGLAANFNFNELCENSLRLIKAARNSNVVPIGTLRFGVCRHRAVLMKYLCDRADPPIPCELVRGYLDFMPHAWNAVHVRKGNVWVRMVVDTCCPTDIREEMDIEYYCRYVPLCRVHLPLPTENSSFFGNYFFSLPLSHGTEGTQSRHVFRCKFGTLDAAVKVRNMESCRASQEELRNFEYSFLGEVRMLGALRKHRCIVEIHAHQLSSKWAPPLDGTKENRLLQSVIVMEYIKGGSVKGYLDKLSERGEKHAPVDIAVCVARDVACALVELHSKHIIHRDIKSENILIDLDSKRSDCTPIVKLADFDRSVPLQSLMHTCCNAHLGIHAPDVCVGTPRWMAPEVVQAMHHRNPYGLEVDIWSYGCLLYELLTLQAPYYGQSEAEIYRLLQMKRRPRLTPELEALALFDNSEHNKILSDASIDKIKLLAELFYDCTSSDPADRPTAQYIYDKLCERFEKFFVDS